MRALVFAPVLFLASCVGPPGECGNPSDYRVLALADGKVYEHQDARIDCTGWTPGCNDANGTPGTTPVYPGNNCACLGYALVAGDFRIAFPPSVVGSVIPLPQGSMTITKKVDVATTCAQGNYYTDYSGTFEGTFGGHTYQRGVFYALGAR